MGYGIHSILQQKTEDGKWENKLYDVIQLCSSEARGFIRILDINAQPGLPEGVGYKFIGDHSHHYITLEEFDDIETRRSKKFSLFEQDGEHHLIIHDEDNDEWRDIEATIKDLQRGFRAMFYDLRAYRLVIGFDC